jgi:hypothetical protein
MDQQGFRENQPNKLSELPSWPITRTENVMYARQVSMELKPGSRKDFTHKIEAEILPLLRKQKGFKDEISFISPDGKNVVAFSLWDNKESAEAYRHGPYAEVNNTLSKLAQGKLRVKDFEVANSTFHKIAATQKAA